MQASVAPLLPFLLNTEVAHHILYPVWNRLKASSAAGLNTTHIGLYKNGAPSPVNPSFLFTVVTLSFDQKLDNPAALCHELVLEEVLLSVGEDSGEK